MHMLDRHVGKLMCTQANLNNKTFGIQFSSYVEWCHSQHVAPKGRVVIAMMTIRFRIDRSRGKQLNMVHLLAQHPAALLQDE